VHLSDRRVQYASSNYRQRLALANLVPSMSRPGNWYDNTMMKSLWNSLKQGLIYRIRLTGYL
jgi:putative transposase